MVQTATAATAAPENPTPIFDKAISLSIQSGERLLELFDKLSKPEQQANEMLKRAALVMALTASETFIESWLKIHLGQNLAMNKVRFLVNIHGRIMFNIMFNFKAPYYVQNTFLCTLRYLH